MLKPAQTTFTVETDDEFRIIVLTEGEWSKGDLKAHNIFIVVERKDVGKRVMRFQQRSTTTTDCRPIEMRIYSLSNPEQDPSRYYPEKGEDFLRMKHSRFLRAWPVGSRGSLQVTLAYPPETFLLEDPPDS